MVGRQSSVVQSWPSSQDGAAHYSNPMELVIWRPTNDLAPLTTYTVSVHMDNSWIDYYTPDVEGTFDVVTAAGPAAELLPPKILSVQPIVRLHGSCRVPALLIRLENDAAGQPDSQVTLSLSAPQSASHDFHDFEPSSFASLATPLGYDLEWFDRSDEYCFTIESYSLATKSHAKIEHCEQHLRHFIEPSDVEWCDDFQPTLNIDVDGAAADEDIARAMDSAPDLVAGEGRAAGCAVSARRPGAPWFLVVIMGLISMLGIQRRSPVRAR